MQARRVWVVGLGIAAGAVLADAAPAHIGFWEDVMHRTAQSDEIRQYAETNVWLVDFKGAVETRKWLDEEAAALKSTMTELGLVK